MVTNSVSQRRSHWFLVVVGLCLFGTSVRADEPEDQRPNCYVLSVGIDKYTRSPLHGCINDARNMARQFRGQEGKTFDRVGVTLLLDEEGNRDRVLREMSRLASAGKAGDFIVLFLSGHGGNNKPGWFFVTRDENNAELRDTTILNFADKAAAQGKKVLVIIDACFAGQLRVNAGKLLNRSYPDGGGVVFMVSSMPSQTSAALGQYSAFAQAVAEGLSGKADFDGDGFVTLREVRRYAYQRVHQMLPKGTQDGEIDYSLSISENLRLAVAGTQVAGTNDDRPSVDTPTIEETNPAPTPESRLTGSNWVGRENLQGFGVLGFAFGANNQVVMIDAQGRSNGEWSMNGDEVTLSFRNGTVIYTGRLQDNVFRGTARGSRGNTWSFAVGAR